MLAATAAQKHLEQVEIRKERCSLFVERSVANHICSLLRLEAEISRHIGTGLLPQELANRGSTIS